MKKLISALLFVFSFNAHAATIDQVFTKLDRVPSDLVDRTSGLKKKTTDTLVGVEATLTAVQGIALGFRASLGVMSGQVKDEVRNGIEDVDVILKNNRKGLAEFLGVKLPPLEVPNADVPVDFTPPDRSGECIPGTPCQLFREKLKELLVSVRDASNAMISINGNSAVSMAINLEQFIDLVDWVPSRALYPLYKMFNAGGAEFFQGLPILLDQLVVDFNYLSPIALSEIISPVTAATNENFPYLLYESKSCQLVVDNYTTVVRAKEGLATTAQVFKIMGKMFIFSGETVAKAPKIAVGFTEFLGLQLELDGNFQQSLGNLLDGLADAADSKASSYEAMIDSCARLRAQLNILDNQAIIMAQMNDIQMSIASTGTSTTLASSDDSSSSGAGAIAFEICMFLILLVALGRRQFSQRLVRADSGDK